MNKTETETIVSSLESLEYTDKARIYGKTFSLGNFYSNDLSDKLVLISLVSLVYIQKKKKDDTITPLQILTHITGQAKDNSGFYQFLESLSILVEDMSYGCVKIDTCGLKTSQEIINKIKELLNTWIPF